MRARLDKSIVDQLLEEHAQSSAGAFAPAGACCAFAGELMALREDLACLIALVDVLVARQNEVNPVGGRLNLSPQLYALACAADQVRGRV